MVKPLTPELLAEAFRLAWVARDRAYAPYSRFAVGAAVYLPEHAAFVTGVNVENVSYGATICAERAALVRSVAEFGRSIIGLIAIVSALEPPITPCGMCLQVLQEFGNPETVVWAESPAGHRASYLLAELLPQAFHTLN